MLVEWMHQLQITLAAGASLYGPASRNLDVSKYKELLIEFSIGNATAAPNLTWTLETAFEDTSPINPAFPTRSGWVTPTNGSLTMTTGTGPIAETIIIRRSDVSPHRRVLRWKLTNNAASAYTFDPRILVELRDSDCSCGG